MQHFVKDALLQQLMSRHKYACTYPLMKHVSVQGIPGAAYTSQSSAGEGSGCDLCLPGEAAPGWTASETGPQPRFFASYLSQKAFPPVVCTWGICLFIFLVARATWCKLPGRRWGALNSSEWRRTKKKPNSCSTQRAGPGILAAELNRVLGMGSGGGRAGGKF